MDLLKLIARMFVGEEDSALYRMFSTPKQLITFKDRDVAHIERSESNPRLTTKTVVPTDEAGKEVSFDEWYGGKWEEILAAERERVEEERKRREKSVGQEKPVLRKVI